jgi:DNA-binding NarL/FixJ family response regulator
MRRRDVACGMLERVDMVAVIKSQVLLVDDHPLFRAGLAVSLAQQPDLQVVAEASCARDALAILAREPVDIAVIDVLMPSSSGVSLAAQMIEARPRCKVLALSVLEEPVMIATMLQAGASGYALKTQTAADIMEAMRSVLAGERYLPPTVSTQAVLALVEGSTDRPLTRLTTREREIFDLLIRGKSNDEISSQLFIARRTVETHRQRIMKKLATHSILDMIRVAAQQGALVE